MHLERVPDATEWGTVTGSGSAAAPLADLRGSCPVPRCLVRLEGTERQTVTGLFGGTSTREVRVERLMAQTEAYVCTECGWFEEYVARPEEVPWNRAEGGRWYSGDAPPR
jgi:hypothetical protein